jgi:Mg-chelatase subunit ChlI
MSSRDKHVLPFSALVGQDDLKLGLILNVVNPRIGGLLVQGPKGTGKSTAVYAVARLLPERWESASCPYRCVPEYGQYLCEDCRARVEEGRELDLDAGTMRVVPLPLSITEDRLVGSIDMERMLSRGEKAFQPGLLASANHNILYVDEINLLPDHVADDILDAAALGWNTVEREGFSITHPASFVLVGTMNPEEGNLRPQLLDRLPLSVSLETIRDAGQRVEIVRRNLLAARDPECFRRSFEEEEERLRRRIPAARKRLPEVGVKLRLLRAVAEMCVDLKVDGHRPEIVITRAAATLAAYRDHKRVREEDVADAARLALGHRTRDGGFQPPATEEEIREALERGLEAARDETDEEELVFGSSGPPPVEAPEGQKKKAT